MRFILSAFVAAALLAWWIGPVRSEPACQSYKNPVTCEVGGRCVWTVTKGKASKCLPLAKAKAPRR